MPRKFLQKYMPDQDKIRSSKLLRLFGDKLHKPNLWRLTRFSTSRAFAIGIFGAFLPMPFQMVVAGALAIVFSANVPISVALVWLTNPITMPPIFFCCYILGTYILGVESGLGEFSMSWQWISHDFWTWLWANIWFIWVPLWVGSLVAGLFFSFISYVGMRLAWRISLRNQWKRRAIRRRSALETA